MKCVVSLLVAVSILAVQAEAKVRRAAEPISGRFIVVFNRTTAAEVPARATALALAHGGRVIGVFKHGIKGFGVELPDHAAEALSLDPRVAWVEEDSIGHPSYEVDNYMTDSHWHLDRLDQVTRIPLHAYKAYGWTFRGNNVNAYLVDSGIQARHVEFDDDGDSSTLGSSSVAAGANFALGDGHLPTNPCGGYTNHYDGGHGTAVASIVGGKSNGVARGVRLVPVKIATCNNNANRTITISQLNTIRSLDWIIADMASSANSNRRGVVNMSFFFQPFSYNNTCDDGQGGTTNCVSAFEHNINSVIAAGIAVVVAANNQNGNFCGTPTAPGQSPARLGYGNEAVYSNGVLAAGYPSTHRTITVGGTDINDARYTCATGCAGPAAVLASGSNFGRCVSIYAPAKNVRTAHINGFGSYRGDAGTLGTAPYAGFNDVTARSGTSFATPVVTGLVARLLQQFPTMSPIDVWLALKARANHPPANFDGDGVAGNDLLAYLSVYD
jgi:hypothetical protein